jgi:hypothetical protein
MHRRLLPWLEPFPLAWNRLFILCRVFDGEPGLLRLKTLSSKQMLSGPVFVYSSDGAPTKCFTMKL